VSVPSSACRHSRFMWLLLLCSFAVRLAWLLTYPRVIENEGAQYARLAQNLFSHNGYQDMRGPTTILSPLYPLLMGAVSLVTKNVELSGRLISLLLGSLVPLVVYLIVDRIYGAQTARVAGLFAAAHPLLIALSASVYSEMGYIFFWLVALYWTLITLQKGRFWAAIWAGTFAGLAYLVRPEGLLFAFLFALWLPAAAWLVYSGSRVLWQRSAALVCASLILAAPFICFLSSETGHFSWEGKSSTNDVINLRLSQGMSYQDAGAGLGPNLYDRGIFLLNNDVLIAKYYPVSFGQKLHLLTDRWPSRSLALLNVLLRARYLGAPLIFLLAIAGLFGGPWNRVRLAYEALLCSMAALVFLILTSVHFVWDRFLFLALPVVLIWAARGAVNCATWLSNAAESLMLLRRNERSFDAAGTVRNRCVVTTACAILFLPAVLAGIHSRAVGEFAESRWIEHKNAGRWIAAHFPASPKITVVSLDMISAYYANATARVLPEADSLTAAAYIHRIDPDFVVLWDQEKFQRPYVEEWIDNGIPDPCANLVYQDGIDVDHRLVIYKWTCSHSESRLESLPAVYR
jgi:hypothetical protein